jgi:RNA polymerase sigma-70 factor (ECF subfamily)
LEARHKFTGFSQSFRENFARLVISPTDSLARSSSLVVIAIMRVKADARPPGGLERTESASFENPVLEAFLAHPSEETYGPVVKYLSPLLLRYFRTRACDLSTAEELTQDVLFTIFRSVDSLRQRGSFQAWMYTVARNCLLQYWRKSGRTIATISADPGALTNTAASVGDCSAPGYKFADLVACLAPEEREILSLRYVEGLEYREIAKVLHTPVGTAKWRVFNCRMKLSLSLKRRVK